MQICLEMGCDFMIKIQVRYGFRWIDVVLFGTKTTTGGGPIIMAANRLRKASKVKWRESRKFKTTSLYSTPKSSSRSFLNRWTTMKKCCNLSPL